MAEGLARRMFGSAVRIQSAGTRPSRVNPYATQVMREVGIDLTAHTSKSIDVIDQDSIDIVVTLCAEEVCPISLLGSASQLNWPIDDPASDDPSLSHAEFLRRFRAARDAIRDKLETHRVELLGITA